MKTDIRVSRSADLPGIEALYPIAFPQEDLVPLVRRLLTEGGVLSLIAESDGEIVGNVIFTPCRVGEQEEKVSMLAPLAVHPDRQGMGVGSRLVEEGLARIAAEGFAKVLVLGDPRYYSRFGFAEEGEITTPCPIPDVWREAWQSLWLGERRPSLRGQLEVRDAWRQPALWTT